MVKRVEQHRLLHQNRQPVDPHPEVHRLAMQEYLQPAVEPEHGILPSIWTIIVSPGRSAWLRSSSTPLGNRTSNATAIQAEVGSTDVASEIDSTATNAKGRFSVIVLVCVCCTGAPGPLAADRPQPVLACWRCRIACDPCCCR
ncbi:hypothetical protein CBM2609_P350019 [Cupriavidus taiwanensis]|uniref:Uncharacterized protein n=2 Tax=Cupriavidus TaxID=106589 RepID=A0A375HWS6_9BURK|nr:hypothetical protein CBM2585_P350017 [Cupriavidus taiwanensis]SPD62553.1 protein of unknown function [Cupriavidus neocaledonicus]SOY75962.1 hypothetical protein CBM2588_P390014 [Cupriavidus taiwanensis]SOY75997.1 hypothetical protein CBM2592_P380019 [Cupriavidus taiwanensis]SOY76788.1 hypothetical protein CBM2589_P350020 [Cupriavidus taiwanensis]